MDWPWFVIPGFDDRDMARAVNEVVKMGGGLVLVSRGKVLKRLGLPVGGLMSDKPVPDLARGVLQSLRSFQRTGEGFKMTIRDLW